MSPAFLVLALVHTASAADVIQMSELPAPAATSAEPVAAFVEVSGNFLYAPHPGMKDPGLPEHIILDVPSLGSSVTLPERREISWFPGSRTWIGQHGTDELILTVYEDRVAGYLNLKGREYSLSGPIDGTLVVIDQSEDELDEEEEEDPPLRGADDTLVLENVGTEGSPLSGGPFQGYDNVVDVLVVYGPPAVASAGSEAQAIANAINGVATANVALASSQTGSVIRLLDVVDIGWDSSGNTCDARRELEDTTDGYADQVQDLRDAYGADLLFGLIGRPEDSSHGSGGGTGCARTPTIDPGPPTADVNHVFTVRVRNTERSTKHEFGHAGGLGHWRDNDQYGKYDDVNPYAFGYLWPDPIEVSDPMTVTNPS